MILNYRNNNFIICQVLYVCNTNPLVPCVSFLVLFIKFCAFLTGWSLEYLCGAISSLVPLVCVCVCMCVCV